MITGLLFTLAQKPPVAANDKNPEGRHFPPAPTKKVKAPHNLVRLTQIVSVILTVIGVSLLSTAAASWSFDPAQGLNIQTALLSFTLPVGVLS
jgi:hypothetical protein